MNGSVPVEHRADRVTAAVWRALGTVRDPELDEPVTELGFVSHCSVGPTGTARVRLRLPTYFCAANFAFLMVADAERAVRAVPGVQAVDVRLEDHFTADEINRAVAAGSGFVDAFRGLAQAELTELRADFLRKAVLGATDAVCRPLLSRGVPAAELARWTLKDPPSSPALDRLRARRRDLGLRTDDDAPLVVDPLTGDPIAARALPRHLDRARLTRVSVEANGEVCRRLLGERYPEVTIRRVHEAVGRPVEGALAGRSPDPHGG